MENLLKMREYINRNWLPFYFWFCSTLLIISGAYYAGINGIYQIVYNSDATHLTQVIAVIVAIAIARIGWLSYKWSQREYYFNDPYEPKMHIWDDALIAHMRKHYSEWWFMGSILVIIGLIGTLIGFAMTFHLLIDAVHANPAGLTSATILKIIPDLLVPIGTVFFPTICGLIGLVIISVQLKLFESFSGIFDDQYEVGRNENEQV